MPETAADKTSQWKRLIPKIRTLGVKSQSLKMSERHRKPNLGVWDVRSVDGGEERVAGLLRAAGNEEEGGVVTFILTLDLEDVVGVCGVMKGMVRTVTAFLERSSANSGKTTAFTGGSGKKAKGTTPLSKLKSVEFGAPLEANEPKPAVGSNTTNDPHVNLMICAILPTPPPHIAAATTMTYRDRQSQYLLSYHLQKYAAEVNCTLCFVDSPTPVDRSIGEITPAATESFEEEAVKDGEEKEGEEGGPGAGKVGKGMRPEGLNIEEVSILVREVCIDPIPKPTDDDGDVVVEEDPMDNDASKGGESQEESKTNEKTSLRTRHYPSLYRPDNHDTDLLHTVFLRNASCAGVWDASRDPLWVALSPPSPTTTATVTAPISSTNTDGGSDEVWLTRLSDSVSGGGGGSGGGDAGSVRSGKSGRSGGSGTIAGKSTSSNNLGDFLGKLGGGDKGDGGSGKVGKEVGAGGEEKKKKKKVSKKKTDSKDVADFFSDLLKK